MGIDKAELKKLLTLFKRMIDITSTTNYYRAVLSYIRTHPDAHITDEELKRWERTPYHFVLSDLQLAKNDKKAFVREYDDITREMRGLPKEEEIDDEDDDDYEDEAEPDPDKKVAPVRIDLSKLATAVADWDKKRSEILEPSHTEKERKVTIDKGKRLPEHVRTYLAMTRTHMQGANRRDAFAAKMRYRQLIFKCAKEYPNEIQYEAGFMDRHSEQFSATVNDLLAAVRGEWTKEEACKRLPINVRKSLVATHTWMSKSEKHKNKYYNLVANCVRLFPDQIDMEAEFMDEGQGNFFYVLQDLVEFKNKKLSILMLPAPDWYTPGELIALEPEQNVAPKLKRQKIYDMNPSQDPHVRLRQISVIWSLTQNQSAHSADYRKVALDRYNDSIQDFVTKFPDYIPNPEGLPENSIRRAIALDLVKEQKRQSLTESSAEEEVDNFSKLP